MMDVSDNPFFALGVSTRATRSQITAAADDKTFLGASESISEFRTALMIPGKRLHAEIRWFPGMDDAKVREVAEFFRELKAGQRKGMMNTSDFRSLARLNFSVYMLGFMKFRDTSNIVRAVMTICGCFDALNIEDICTAINNDRMIAGFPAVDEVELERGINDYRGDILAVIAGKMSELPQDEYRIVAEKLAGEYADEGGKYYGSLLIGDFLAAYELNILPKLDEHMNKIRASASSIREFLPATVFADLLRGLEEWRELAGPLILSAGGTGLENANIRGQAEEIFGAVREWAVALHNEHGKTSEALRLILKAQEYLARISAGISRAIKNDLRELEKLEREKRKAEQERNAWEKSLRYETEKIFTRLKDGELLFFGSIKVKDNGVLRISLIH